MSEDFTPETQPSGSLLPPDKNPPTAVGAASSPPPRPLPALPRTRGRSIGAFVEQLLDTLDVVGDSIARAAGLRRERQTRNP